MRIILSRIVRRIDRAELSIIEHGIGIRTGRRSWNSHIKAKRKAIMVKLLLLICLMVISYILYCNIPYLSPLLSKVGISLVGRGISAFGVKMGAPGGIALAIGSFLFISEAFSCNMMADSGSGSGEGAGGTDDLSAVVAPYIRGSGSGTGGSVQPPGPSGGFPIMGSNSGALSPSWSVGPPASAESGGSYSSWIAELQGQADHPVEEVEQPLLEVEERNRRFREETDRRIRDLQNDNDINLTENVAYRNALIKQEEISGVMAEIINERGISVTDPDESAARASANYLTPVIVEKECNERAEGTGARDKQSEASQE